VKEAVRLRKLVRKMCFQRDGGQKFGLLMEGLEIRMTSPFQLFDDRLFICSNLRQGKISRNVINAKQRNIYAGSIRINE
jgi:hypothetical protein